MKCPRCKQEVTFDTEADERFFVFMGKCAECCNEENPEGRIIDGCAVEEPEEP